MQAALGSSVWLLVLTSCCVLPSYSLLPAGSTCPCFKSRVAAVQGLKKRFHLALPEPQVNNGGCWCWCLRALTGGCTMAAASAEAGKG